MGMVYVTAEIGPDWEHLAPVRFLVDTEALYTFVSPQLVEGLGLVMSESTYVVVANGQRLAVPIGMGALRVDGRQGPALVAAMEVPVPLLGAMALQALGLKVNPVDEVLEPYGVYPPKA